MLHGYLDHFFVSLIRTGGLVSERISVWLKKGQLNFANLHLWRIRDPSIYQLMVVVYCSTVRSVLLDDCGAWPLKIEDIWRLLVFIVTNGCKTLRDITRNQIQLHSYTNSLSSFRS